MYRPTIKSTLGSRVFLRFQSSHIKQLSSFKEFELAIAADKLSLIDFYATWCGPCKSISHHIEKLSDKFKDVAFFKVDVDQNPEIAGHLNVTAMPTFIYFKKGKELGKIVGADPAGIKNELDRFSKCL